MEELATFVLQWCAEHGRALEYRLPDGSLVPLDDDELAAILAGIRFSPNVSAAAGFHGEGRSGSAAKQRHRPGVKPATRLCILEEIKAGIASGEFTAAQLRRRRLNGTQQKWLETRFRAHHSTIERALAELP